MDRTLPFSRREDAVLLRQRRRGRYYCFGCRASGDQITFVREMQHLDFVDALRLLADRAGIELHDDASAGPARKERQEYMAAMEKAVEWYHERLLKGADARPAREYLRSRGIDGEVARQFKLGWAPDEWDGLAKALDFNEKVLVGTGLGFVNKGERRQDALRARIIFPIFDSAGKAIAVGGRILPSSASPRPDGRVEAKYKNSPRRSSTPSDARSTRSTGPRTTSSARARSSSARATPTSLRSSARACEGRRDLRHGARRGAFSRHAQLRQANRPGVRRGQRRPERSRVGLPVGAPARGRRLRRSAAQGQRPRRPRAKGPGGLASVSERRVPFLQFRLDRVLDAANLSTAEGRVRAAELAMEVLAEHPSELVRDQYTMDVAYKLRLEESTLRPRVAEIARSGVRRQIPNEPPTTPCAATSWTRARDAAPGTGALRLCVHLSGDVRDRLISAYFVNDVQREIFEGLVTGQPISDVIDQLQRRGEEDAALVLSQLVVDELDREYTSADVSAVVSQLIRSAVGEELRNVERELRDGVIAPISRWPRSAT